MHEQLPARPDLEWYRKQAKVLVRAHAAGEPDTVARVEETLGPRGRERFRLTDAQWVIAQEHGFRSWAELVRRIESTSAPAGGLALAFERVWATWRERGKAELDSGLRYGGVDPVVVHVSKRERRWSFSDDGAAVGLAGKPPGWREAADAVVDAYVVNVSRKGVVYLPAVERHELAWLSSLPQRIAEASVALYGALLELE